MRSQVKNVHEACAPRWLPQVLALMTIIDPEANEHVPPQSYLPRPSRSPREAAFHPRGTAGGTKVGTKWPVSGKGKTLTQACPMPVLRAPPVPQALIIITLMLSPQAHKPLTPSPVLQGNAG